MIAIAATLFVGDYRWDGSPMLWIGLAWSVLALSTAGLSLLVWLVRHQGPTRMSMLLLLVPPLAAVEAWLLFGERLGPVQLIGFALALGGRSEEHTSELQSLMRISYAVFCLKKKKNRK